MCWVSAIRSVGWPWGWWLGRWCWPVPSEPLEEASCGRQGPHRGRGGDPQDPGRTAGVGAQAGVSLPPHTLWGWPCHLGPVCAQCVRVL